MVVIITFLFSDPPLEDADVPTGEWICNECKYGKDVSK